MQCGVDVGMVAANIGNIGLVPCRFLVVVWFSSVLFAFWLVGCFVCFGYVLFVLLVVLFCMFFGWVVVICLFFGLVVV